MRNIVKTLSAALLSIAFALSLAGCHPSATDAADLVLDVAQRATEATAPAEDAAYEVATLLEVIDGDTLRVRLADGSVEKVRLIGVDTPESVHPDASRNSQAGVDASAHTKELLEGVETLYLVRDVSDTDRYGRLLRYVWTDVPTEGAEAESMLNARLVADGYAVAKDYAPDTSYSDLFHALEG